MGNPQPIRKPPTALDKTFGIPSLENSAFHSLNVGAFRLHETSNNDFIQRTDAKPENNFVSPSVNELGIFVAPRASKNEGSLAAAQPYVKSIEQQQKKVPARRFPNAPRVT